MWSFKLIITDCDISKLHKINLPNSISQVQTSVWILLYLEYVNILWLWNSSMVFIALCDCDLGSDFAQRYQSLPYKIQIWQCTIFFKVSLCVPYLLQMSEERAEAAVLCILSPLHWSFVPFFAVFFYFDLHSIFKNTHGNLHFE